MLGKYIVEDGDYLKSLTKYNIKELELKNRIVMPPMCIYSSEEDGIVKDFHNIHYTSRAMGGVGLIILEATGVVPNGRISSGDLGIWSDEHIPGLKSLVDNSHLYGAKIGIQLAHAGRKCESNDEYIVAPSPIRFNEDYRVPRELTIDEIRDLVLKFRDAAIRADKAGFDLIELHAAHGYLIHEFLSPLTNKRTDEYGGNLENRTRFLKEILSSIKEIWPEEKPILVRVSAEDYSEGGIDIPEIVKIINEIKDNLDMVHVSTGGLVPNVKMNLFPGYQVKHCEAIRKECNVPTIAVGLIKEYDHIEEILNNDRADLVALGRELLRNPSFVSRMAYDNKLEVDCPKQYKRSFM